MIRDGYYLLKGEPFEVADRWTTAAPLIIDASRFLSSRLLTYAVTTNRSPCLRFAFADSVKGTSADKRPPIANLKRNERGEQLIKDRFSSRLLTASNEKLQATLSQKVCQSRRLQPSNSMLSKCMFTGRYVALLSSALGLSAPP